MNITIFGGTGISGILTIEKALTKGHKVTIYARNPSKISLEHENLHIVEGSLTDDKKIDNAIKGADAVISLLGPTGKSKGLILSSAMKKIIQFMEKYGVKRLIATATPSFKDKNDKFQFGFALGAFLVKTFLGDTYDDIVEIGNSITKSNLDWTIVRLPMLSNNRLSKLHIGYLGDGKTKMFSLTRENLSDFLLEQLEESKYVKKSPVICNY